MKMTIYIRIVVFATFAALLTVPCRIVAQQTNPEVQYYVLGEKYPKGLNDFQAFGLFRKETAGGKVKLDGWVMSDREDPNDSTVTMKSLRLDGKHLTFTAQTHKGITFKFDGRFLRSGDFKPYFNKPVPIVEGMVRKLRKGRTLAEAKMRFTCGVGG
jgi:hypothetical protein